jgi:hypothetical protein
MEGGRGAFHQKALQIVSLMVLPTSSAESFSGDVTRERSPADQGLVVALSQGKQYLDAARHVASPARKNGS